MTEPILEHIWHDLTSHLPHHHATTPAAQPERHTTMSVLSELGAKAQEAVDNIDGWVSTLKQHVPAMAAEAAKYAGNPLLDAIIENDLHVPADAVDIVLSLLKRLADPAVVPAAVTPAVPAADVPAPPDPAVQQVAS